MDNDRRADDVELARLTQQFEDFLAQYKANQVEALEWRGKFETSLICVKKNVDKLMTPFKIISWVGTITGAAFMVEMAKEIVGYLKNHIK